MSRFLFHLNFFCSILQIFKLQFALLVARWQCRLYFSQKCKSRGDIFPLEVNWEKLTDWLNSFWNNNDPGTVAVSKIYLCLNQPKTLTIGIRSHKLTFLSFEYGAFEYSFASSINECRYTVFRMSHIGWR